MIDKVRGRRIGADINPYVIDALIAIRDNITELPKNNKEFTENDYEKLKNTNDYQYKGYAGFSFSYAGKWLGGWCRDKENKRDYVAEAYKNAKKQSPKLQGVKFYNLSYEKLELPQRSLIYCDPPYANSTGYAIKGFEHNIFWQWCRDKEREGHTVFISEYTAPHDFEPIWEREMCSSLTQNTGEKQATEKLFRLKKR